MSYYAHFGHTDFILCLGYKAEVIKEYFLALQRGALQRLRAVRRRAAGRAAAARDIQDWWITFVDTGLQATIGERLQGGAAATSRTSEIFLANYGDVLTDAPLDRAWSRDFRERRRSALLPVRPPDATPSTSSNVRRRRRVSEHRRTSTNRDLWINGGLLRLPPRDLRLHAARARSSSRSRSGG